jgi:hypothetical protein
LDRGSKNLSSKYSASLGDAQINAAYVTIEGMIIYNCQSYPTNQGINFTQNKLVLGDGSIDSPVWTPEIRHTECGQSVENGPNGDVYLHYDPTK